MSTAPHPDRSSGNESATVPLHHYMVALDEIYSLRRALAYEAGRTAADLQYKTFPKSRRAIAENAINRMRSAARGFVEHAYGDRSTTVLHHAMREADAPTTLTRHAWETSRGLTSTPHDLGQCHNSHPFAPGTSIDHAPGESDPRWCNNCGEARVPASQGES